MTIGRCMRRSFDPEKSKRWTVTINRMGVSAIITVILMFFIELILKSKWILWLFIFLAVYLLIKRWKKK